jgi:molybdate/tungstate transport system substrate-binding protein
MEDESVMRLIIYDILNLTLPFSTSIKFIAIVFLAIVILFSIFLDSGSVVANSQQTTSSSSSSSSQGKVFVMYAASLVKTFEDSLGPSFHNKTGYKYTGEARGAIQIANMIIDEQRTPDIFVSAGTVPIRKLMMNDSNNNSDADSSQAHSLLAQWLVKFASTEIVIAYSPNSHFHVNLDKAKRGEIPWYHVLSEPGFKFGRTDPELDPKGYYMIIAAKLSNLYYHDPTIKQKILGDDDRNPKQVFAEETLITTLETGQLDAIAAYKHEAIPKGLPYITLPPQINLANPTYSDFYKRASYTLQHTGQTIYGEPVYFAVTIPRTVKNSDGAISFVKFLLSADGQHILQSQGLNHIQKPIFEGNMDKIPSAIRNIMTLAE